MTFTLCVALAACSHAQVRWLGGDGTWDDASRWSAGVVPHIANATAIDVVIDDDTTTRSAVTLTAAARSVTRVNNLMITSGDTLRLDRAPDGWSTPKLAVDGHLTVDGTLRLGAPGSASSVGSVTLGANREIQGTGTIELLGSTIDPGGIRSTGSLMIGPGLTVRAAVYGINLYGFGGATIGTDGASAGTFTNRGRIFVDAGRTLVLSGSDFVNDGAIEIGANAQLGLRGTVDRRTLGRLDVSAGTVEVRGRLENASQILDLGRPGAGGGWRLIGTLHGGTLRGAGGVLNVPLSNAATLENVTLVDDATITVGGTLELRDVRGQGTIQIEGADIIEGLGIIRTSGTLPVGITVRGGVLDDFGFQTEKCRLIANRNEGRIRADGRATGTAAMNISVSDRPVLGTFTNAGTLEVSANSILRILASQLESEIGAQLVVDGGGLLSVTGGALIAGTSLRVLPKADGTAYDNEQIIMTDGGLLTGRFSSGPRGITVRYTPTGAFISGTPVPEPAAALLVAAVGGSVAARRRRR